jgi:hypothetical protein
MKAKKPLKAKTRLVGKMNIGAKTPMKKTPKKHTLAWYKKEARTYFNRAVKYRDSELIEGEFLFQCITCSKRVLFRDRDGRFYRNAHAGHFQPEIRGNTRFNEMNVNGQCASCNFNQGEQYRYAKAIDLKYGAGIADELEAEAKILKQWTIPELQQIIADYKEECRFYESQAQA